MMETRQTKLFRMVRLAQKAGEILDVSSRTIETYFAKLKEYDFIKREGSDKTGEWLLINNDL